MLLVPVLKFCFIFANWGVGKKEGGGRAVPVSSLGLVGMRGCGSIRFRELSVTARDNGGLCEGPGVWGDRRPVTPGRCTGY